MLGFFSRCSSKRDLFFFVYSRIKIESLLNLFIKFSFFFLFQNEKISISIPCGFTCWEFKNLSIGGYWEWNKDARYSNFMEFHLDFISLIPLRQITKVSLRLSQTTNHNSKREIQPYDTIRYRIQFKFSYFYQSKSLSGVYRYSLFALENWFLFKYQMTRLLLLFCCSLL